jgi:hypothetical protein
MPGQKRLVLDNVGNYMNNNNYRNRSAKKSHSYMAYRTSKRPNINSTNNSNNGNRSNGNRSNGNRRKSKRFKSKQSTNNLPITHTLTGSQVLGHGNGNGNGNGNGSASNDELVELFGKQMSMQMEVNKTPPPAAAPSKRNLFKPVSSKLNSNSSLRSRSV